MYAIGSERKYAYRSVCCGSMSKCAYTVQAIIAFMLRNTRALNFIEAFA